jgi:hypothetical protein
VSLWVLSVRCELTIRKKRNSFHEDVSPGSVAHLYMVAHHSSSSSSSSSGITVWLSFACCFGLATAESELLLGSLSAGGSHSCVIRYHKAFAGWSMGESALSIPRWVDDGAVYNVREGTWSGGAKLDTADPEINPSERPEVFCWGMSFHSRTIPPAGVAFKTLSVGFEHTCGIDMAGKIHCWGNLSWERGKAPPGRGFVSIAAGSYHTCAIDSEQNMHCWGQNKSGQCNAPDIQNLVMSAEAGKGGWVSVSAGWSHSCGLDVNGQAHCWGSNEKGQSLTWAGTTFKSISCGNLHTCGIDLNARAHCWGDNDSGQSRVPKGISFATISAGGGHTCGVDPQGNPHCWGWDGIGDVRWAGNALKNIPFTPGVGNWKQTKAPKGKYLAISAGDSHTCALLVEGGLRCWGVNENREVDVPRQLQASRDLQPPANHGEL